MLEVIKSQGTKSTPTPNDRRSEAVNEPLCRAPGISERAVTQALKPLTRAATEPVRNVRATVEEASSLQNHWLFRDTQNPPTAPCQSLGKEDPQRSGKSSPVSREDQLPLCGIASANVEHMFMGWESETKQRATSMLLHSHTSTRTKPKCQHCAVLSETVDRLRTTLSRSRESSPKLEGGSFPSTKEAQSTKHPQSSAQTKGPEMRQIPPIVSKILENGSQRAPLARRIDTEQTTSHAHLENLELSPSRGNLGRESRHDPDINLTCLPQAKPQRRSVTFDSQLIDSQQPPTMYGKYSAPDQYYINAKPANQSLHLDRPFGITRNNVEAGLRARRSMGMAPTAQASPVRGDLKFPSMPPGESGTQHATKPSTYCGSPTSFLPPLAKGTFACQMPLDTMTRGGLAAAHEREEQRKQQLEHLRQAEPLPLLHAPEYSLPDNGFITGNSDDSRHPRQTATTTVPSIQEQDLRRRHSMGSSLKPSSTTATLQSRHPSIPVYPNPNAESSRRAHTTPWRHHTDGATVTYPHEHAERMDSRTNPFIRSTNTTTSNIYMMNRPGGEEISGVDYAN